MNPEPNFLNIPASPFDLNAQTQNIVPTKQTSNQLPSIQFDQINGWIGILGNDDNNIVTQTITDQGYYQFDIDGNIFSSDRTSSSFWQGLDGAIDDNVVGINFDGGLGNDTLIVGSQNHHKSFDILADDTIQIQGEIQTESLSIKAQDILNQSIITANSLTAEFSNSYTDTAEAQIVAGNILLNGNTGNLQAQGQFLAAGTTGGKIDLRAQTISLKGANLDASGENGGGTILIGGDYQGINSGNLTNAQSTFVDRYSTIKANANQTGNGGKVIIWADGDTDFQGNINARGGRRSGDGGFAEISGKQNLNFVGDVDVDAPNGIQGNILLDPSDIIINADDGNEKTFDISDLYNLKGNINLSASNSIVFNVDAYFDKAQGTISLQAGGAVSLYGNFLTGGGNISISSQDVFLQGGLNTAPSTNRNSGNRNSGSINLVSKGNITSQKSISSTSYFGDSGNIKIQAAGTVNIQDDVVVASLQANAGSIFINAGGEIKANSIYSLIFYSIENNDGVFYTGSGKSGNIDIVGENNVTIQTSLISSSNAGTGGNISVTAQGDIQSGSISTNTDKGNAGKVILNAKGDIRGEGIFTYSNSMDAGSIQVTSTEGNIDFGQNTLVATSEQGKGGNITLTAKSNITGGEISTYSKSMDAGSIQLTSTEGNIDFGQGTIQAYSDKGSAGNITLIANSQENNRSITTGFLNTLTDGNGNGGNVKLVASGDILTSSIYTFSRGDGNCGNISLETTNGSIDTTNANNAGFLITSTNGNGNAGNVMLLAKGNILATLVNAYTTGSGNGGNVTFKSISGSISTKNPSSDPTAGIVATSANTGNAGAVELEAEGDIQTGSINATSNTGDAGNIKLEAKGDIEIGAITSNVLAGSGNGGDISLTSSNGNITSDYLRSDSVSGTGGNITLDAGKLIKVQGSISIDELDYSIYASGYVEGNSIKIKHGGGATDNPFVVSALSGVGAMMPFTNGVVANIASATSGIFSVVNPLSYPSSHTLGDISITTNYTGNSPQANVPIGDIVGFESLYNENNVFLDTRIPSPTLIASTDISSGLTVPVTSVIIPKPWNRPGEQPTNVYIGNEAHKIIAVNYRTFHPKNVVFTNYTEVRSILDKTNTIVPASLTQVELDKRPDILDFTQKFIYEIKSRKEAALAVPEAEYFIRIFKKANINLTLGPVGEIGTYNVLPFPGGLFAFASVTPGAIIYRRYVREDKTDVDDSKITRSNILEAIGRDKDGFPDDIFAPVPTTVSPVPETSNPLIPAPSLDLINIPIILYKFIDFIFSGGSPRTQ